MELKIVECNRCFHKWPTKMEKGPSNCPKCHSPYWNKPRVNAAKLKVYYSRKWTINHNFFRKINTSQKAWCLGFIAADGCVYHKNKGYYLTINVALKDKEILIKILKAMKATYPISKRVCGEKESYRIDICSKVLFEDLTAHGICERKTFEGRGIEKVPDRLFSHYIRGVFDGDGCIGKYTQRQKYSVLQVEFAGNRYYLTQIKSYLEKKLNIGNPMLKPIGNEPTVVLTYCGNYQVKKIMGLIYKNAIIYLKRKKMVWNRIKWCKCT